MYLIILVVQVLSYKNLSSILRGGLSLHLVEASPALSAIQEGTLQGIDIRLVHVLDCSILLLFCVISGVDVNPPITADTPSLVPRPNPHAGKRVWCTSSDFLGFQDAKQSCDINYCHGNALSGMRVAHATMLWPQLRCWCAVT